MPKLPGLEAVSLAFELIFLFSAVSVCGHWQRDWHLFVLNKVRTGILKGFHSRDSKMAARGRRQKACFLK
jgi:hypothetical protein